MQDTPDHIKQLQLDIWLSKTITERLEQFITDNDALFTMWREAQKQISLNNNGSTTVFNFNLQKTN
jgi:hypothetical protein